MTHRNGVSRLIEKDWHEPQRFIMFFTKGNILAPIHFLRYVIIAAEKSRTAENRKTTV